MTTPAPFPAPTRAEPGGAPLWLSRAPGTPEAVWQKAADDVLRRLQWNAERTIAAGWCLVLRDSFAHYAMWCLNPGWTIAQVERVTKTLVVVRGRALADIARGGRAEGTGLGPEYRLAMTDGKYRRDSVMWDRAYSPEAADWPVIVDVIRRRELGRAIENAPPRAWTSAVPVETLRAVFEALYPGSTSAIVTAHIPAETFHAPKP